MGAYAVYSDKPFRTNSKIKMKRKRGRIDDLMELITGTHLEFDKNTGEHRLMRDNEIIGVFVEDDDNTEK